ncbi:phosphodiester glycosidase family protein [Streptomyces europaeiscabiei]|uniref:phosphodiester glycosidase family protein n=1 Tax=Streptomyces europaeiscabiei TaxID=146819 RepID=UPI000A433171|nr:phosphodiester glycosidase family protein [Streptomyces europaeiscabiei]MDX2529178.1 phosphodiester glycosidase family protein [Streptomyces europaeiscabiei]MDX2758895.1 phosphodiester glycosidase family protein [Streptomyces europaeiscabiei]MDX2768291.1 phosphodiester glycosidase family protein [Streptomyces europaeiscabiei]MDX3670299.1 phosphodiester glycosidase family protein [Streptomyces europaeiscabiei]MDX3846584.1 phosphodiester glycosidase family protein [Streptomyces europaeiscabie
MTRRAGRFRTVLTLLSAWSVLAGAALVGAAPASGAPRAVTVAPGVEYTHFDIRAAMGLTHAHVLSVDLRNRQVGVGLLYPTKVAARATVSRLATSAGAVAGVNGDFFNNTETQHPGVAATGAPVGPAVAGGHALKAAVPKGQRFGPSLPPGTSTEDVLGVTTDGTARLDSLALDGSVTTPEGDLPLRGLNQYALPVGSVGAFTPDWGSVSRMRAVCGTDTDRAAPCSTDTHEVLVEDGRVVGSAGTPGSGAIAAGATVLVGREAGAQRLRRLSPGDSVEVQHVLVASTGTPYAFALGGYPVLRGGRPLPGLDDTTSAVRTAAGIADGGHRLLLLALDGAAAYRTGLTIAEVADTLRELGSVEAFSLDGGGSSTLVARAPGASAVTVRNHPSDGAERAVPNGIGVFTKA